MLKTNHKVSKLGFSLGVALLLSGAASAVRATPFPTTSDEARPLGAKLATLEAAVMVPGKGTVSSTDEARVLAASSLPIPSAPALVSKVVTSTDEARNAVRGDRFVSVEIGRPEEGRAVAGNSSAGRSR